MSDITIRPARHTDSSDLARLAELDSRRIPAGDLLLAEVCGRPVAAFAPVSDEVIADPFRRTADVVELLRVHGARRRPRRRRGFLLPTPRLA